MTRAHALALVLVLTVSLLAVPMPGLADDEPEPELSVTYDEFNEDADLIEAFEDGGDATVEKQNTQVVVDADEAFVRLHAENANSYAVEYTIRMHPDVVETATIGSVDAVDEDVTADWRAVHDFDTEQTYTEVTVIVPAQTQVTFAPSQLRVKSLSWTSDAESSGLVDGIRERVGWGSELEERTYAVEGETGEQITLPLTHPDDANTQIDDWHATYTIDDTERPLSQGAGEEVFYRTIDDGEAVEIVFNTDAEVEFVADPTFRDSASYQTTSFLSSLSDAVSVPFLLVDVPVAPAAEVIR